MGTRVCGVASAAWEGRSSGSPRTSCRRRSGRGRRTRRSCRTTTSAPSSGPAGGALLVPPSSDGVAETLDALDGLILSGGADLDPALYGQEPHAETDAGRRGARRRRARAAARRARARPAGARDLPRLAGAERRARRRPRPAPAGGRRRRAPHARRRATFAEHEVRDRRRLAPRPASLGPRAAVKSHHHQGFGRIGDGLAATGPRRGRHGRGARGAVAALRGRRALAPRGGRGRAALRRARRRGGGVPGRAALTYSAARPPMERDTDLVALGHPGNEPLRGARVVPEPGRVARRDAERRAHRRLPGHRPARHVHGRDRVLRRARTASSRSR